MSRSVLTFQSTFSIRRETLPVPDSTPQRCTFQSTLSIQELTAHSGARPEHARWQGQLVTLTGEDAGETIDGLYVYTLHEIGYGDGRGFKGWNCRHDWHAYYKGISKPNYTPEQIAKLNEKSISYNDKKYTEYEISQMQRAGERNVRALKRRTLAAQTAVENAPDEGTRAALQTDYEANAAKLKAAEKTLKDFCRQTRRRNDTFRSQVNGFGRSASQKAVHAAKEFDKYKEIRYNEDGTIIVTDDWKSKGKVSVPQKYKPNAVVETSTASKNGNIQTDRTIYDENGRMKVQIHGGDHGKPKLHPYGNNGEHHHYYTWEKNKKHPIRITDNLTDDERKEHGDIL